MMLTIAQLRAVLAILRIDPAEIGAQDGGRGFPGPVSERSLLVGLLYRAVSGELRRVLTTSMTEDEVAHTAAMSTRPVNGENACEQAGFDARWLRDRIDALAAETTVDPAPILLDAAARSADATEALLSLSRNPGDGDAESRWLQALDDLGQAYHLINDEYVERSNATTAPLR
ncbi:hypothetical protein ACFQZZ_32980 [Nocardia sp. GCM10030253]|uniref:hypothetical protein n=1 Tax=Nocardia sp. GCM10030253 TaxID=3273404 RepID=UPI00364074BD